MRRDQLWYWENEIKMENEEYRSDNLKASKTENILPGRFILNGVNKLFFLQFLRGLWGIASSLMILWPGQGKNRINCDCESLVLLLQYIAWCTMLHCSGEKKAVCQTSVDISSSWTEEKSPVTLYKWKHVISLSHFQL